MELTVPAIRPIRVLVVEDEVLISEWVAEALTEQGFAVQIAGNAAEALQHLKVSPVDVLFTDVNLPGNMDGTALAHRARQLIPGLPVVYASGRMSVVDSALRVPGSLFVAKPYDTALIGRLLADAAKATGDLVPA
jgi:CheY-like chemotaxis protein